MVAASNVKLASMPKYNKDLHSEIVYFNPKKIWSCLVVDNDS